MLCKCIHLPDFHDLKDSRLSYSQLIDLLGFVSEIWELVPPASRPRLWLVRICGAESLLLQYKGGGLWVSGTQLPLFLVINCFKDVLTVRQEPCLLLRLQGRGLQVRKKSDLLILGSEEEGVVGFCCIAAHLSKTKHKEQQLKHGRNDTGWFVRAE